MPTFFKNVVAGQDLVKLKKEHCYAVSKLDVLANVDNQILSNLSIRSESSLERLSQKMRMERFVKVSQIIKSDMPRFMFSANVTEASESSFIFPLNPQIDGALNDSN